MRQAPGAPLVPIGQCCCPSSLSRILLALCLPRQPAYPPPAGKVSHAKLGGESAGLSPKLVWAAAAAATGDRAGGASRARRQEKSHCSGSRRLCRFLGSVCPARVSPAQPPQPPATPEEKRPRGGSSCSIISDPPAMEDLDQSPLVSSSADSPPRPPPAFQYQFVTDPEYEEDEEEEDEEEEDDEDLEELEVLERKPAVGLSAAPVPPAAAAPAPLLDFGSDSVPPAPRGPLPAAPPAAPERQPSWERSPAAPAPSLPAAAAVLPSQLPEDDEPPARPPPPPPAGASPLAEPAAPPSTPAAPKRRGSGSVGECRRVPVPPDPPSFVCWPGEGAGRAALGPEGLCLLAAGRWRPRRRVAGRRVGRPRKPGCLHCLSGFRGARAPQPSP